MLGPGKVFLLLIGAFLIYSFSIYLYPYFAETSRQGWTENEQAGKGKLVWQKYNCQSCHQLYGLGGYLGPDLTNLFSTKEKNRTYLEAMLNSGSKQMPVFRLSSQEVDELAAFLEETDKSGISDPRSFKISVSGMISRRSEP